MFERFTEGARFAIVMAQDEARALHHDYIGTEHVLLGLIQREGVAATAFSSLGVTVDEVRAEVVALVGEGKEHPSGQIPFTPRAKKVLELSLLEALALEHNYVGTEHLLLGLLTLDESVALEILVALGVGTDDVRDEVVGLLSDPRRVHPGAFSASAGASRRFPPVSDELRQAITVALDAVEAARNVAKRENDTRRMAVIVQAGRLLERLLRRTLPGKPESN